MNKRNKRNRVPVCGIILFLPLLLLTLSGCSKRTENSTRTGLLTHVYSGEKLSIPDGYSCELSVTPIFLPDKEIVRYCAVRFEWHETEEGRSVYRGTYRLVGVHLSEAMDGGTIDEDIPIQIEEGAVFYGGSFTGEAFRYLTASFDAMGNRSLTLLDLDITTGEKTRSVSLDGLFGAEYQNASFGEIAIAGDGQVYLISYDQILVIGDDGTRLTGIPAQADRFLALPDGRVEAVIHSPLGQSVVPILLDEGKLGGEDVSVPWNGKTWADADGTLYTAQSNGLFASSDTVEPILAADWLNSDVDFGSSTVLAVPDSTTILLAESETSEDGIQSNNLYIYRKTEDIDLSSVKTVQIAFTKPFSGEVSGAIRAFNRSHGDIRVISLDYTARNTDDDPSAGESALAFDLANGLCTPDLIVGTTTHTAVRWLLDNNLYVDLAPYCEKDALFNRETVFGAAFCALSDGERMWGIGGAFTISSLLSTGKFVGEDFNGWDMETFINFLKSLPDEVEAVATVRRDRAWKNNILLGPKGTGDFIDRAEGMCRYESDEFTCYLDYLASIPDDAGWERVSPLAGLDQSERTAAYWNGKVVLMPEVIRSVGNFIHLTSVFGDEDWILAGYPSKDGNGSYVDFEEVCVIPSCAIEKEGAWELARDIAALQSKKTDGAGLPALKTDFLREAERYSGLEYVYYQRGGSTVRQIHDHEDLSEPGVSVTLDAEKVNQIKEWLDRGDFDSLSDAAPSSVEDIVREEISQFMAGVGSAEDCTKRIQSRVGIWLAEHK